MWPISIVCRQFLFCIKNFSGIAPNIAGCCCQPRLRPNSWGACYDPCPVVYGKEVAQLSVRALEPPRRLPSTCMKPAGIPHSDALRPRAKPQTASGPDTFDDTANTEVGFRTVSFSIWRPWPYPPARAVPLSADGICEQHLCVRARRTLWFQPAGTRSVNALSPERPGKFAVRAVHVTQ
jgi:hypothetical protein